MAEPIEAWCNEAGQALQDLHERLEAEVAAAGVPDDQARAKAAELATAYEDVRRTLGREHLSLYKARSLRTRLHSADLQKELRRQELRRLYTPVPLDGRLHLTWQSVAGRAEIKSEIDLDALIQRIRTNIAANLGDGKNAGR